ncbi:MAG: diphthamide biosynthesis enzyme Dph2 [Candidatus Thermoplasmatota archaeon]|nr:diphthamide biosynthesis enzyme Dph2 [Candidatus Thermoplasmatota archaeon]
MASSAYTLDHLNACYDIEIDWIVETLNKRDDEVVGLQFPDGLRDYGPALADWLHEEVGCEVVLSGDASFGACDIALDMERIGVDVLIHFGHSPMPSIGPVEAFDVLFVPTHSKAPIDEIVKKAAAQLKGKRIGLLTTAQHASKMDEAADILEENGCEPHINYGDNRVFNPGQLLGCNFTAARTVAEEVDVFLYIGSGDFHPIAAAWGLETPVWVADPMTGEVKKVEDRVEALMRQRYAAIAQAEEAESFGILVATRIGQERMKLAKGLAKLLRKHGKKAYIISLDFFTPEALASFRHLDAFVNTGCPRITTDDYARYDAPMLTPPELEIVLGKRDWEDYRFDEFKGTKPGPHQEEGAIELPEAS